MVKNTCSVLFMILFFSAGLLAEQTATNSDLLKAFEDEDFQVREAALTELTRRGMIAQNSNQFAEDVLQILRRETRSRTQPEMESRVRLAVTSMVEKGALKCEKLTVPIMGGFPRSEFTQAMRDFLVKDSEVAHVVADLGKTLTKSELKQVGYDGELMGLYRAKALERGRDPNFSSSQAAKDIREQTYGVYKAALERAKYAVRLGERDGSFQSYVVSGERLKGSYRGHLVPGSFQISSEAVITLRPHDLPIRLYCGQVNGLNVRDRGPLDPVYLHASVTISTEGLYMPLVQYSATREEFANFPFRQGFDRPNHNISGFGRYIFRFAPTELVSNDGRGNVSRITRSPDNVPEPRLEAVE